MTKPSNQILSTKPFIRVLSTKPVIESFDSEPPNKYLVNQYKLKYMDEVYFNTMKSFGLFGGSSLFGAMFVSNMNLSDEVGFMSGLISLLGLTGYSFYTVYKTVKIEPKIIEKENGVYEELSNETKNNYLKKCVISLGLLNTPVVLMAAQVDPIILPSALLVTLGTSGSLCLLAKNLHEKNYNLIKFHAPLVAGLWGLIGIGVLDILGVKIMSLTTQSVLGVGIFSFLTAVDTQMIIKSYDEKKLDKYGHTLNMTLNLINLFQKITIILTEMKKN